MGYHKNQLIAEQVELGDRVPAPRSAESHVSLTRRQTVDARRIAAERMREYRRAERGLAISGGLIGLALGICLGMIVGMVWL